jgi:predicted CXXCH cytochrome family protein
VRRALTAAALIGALACAAAWLGPRAIALEIDPPARSGGPSNIRAADYVGPEACGECHGERHRQWSSNLHRSMNRRAGDPGVIAGDFSGVELRYGGRVARFDRDDDGRPRMILDGRAYRITRTIGSRYIQEYVGTGGGGEVRLPFGYWISRGRWYHNQYYDSWYGPEYDETGALAIDPFEPEPWASRCAWCHNTYPFELRIARADSTDVARHGPEAHVTAPTEPRPDLAATNRGLYRSAERTKAEVNPDRRSGNALPAAELVTVGISCESCHFGGRDHAVDGSAIRFYPTAPDLERRPGGADLTGGRDSAVTVNTICSQCHSAPSPLWPGGAATRNSREALDLAGSGCEPRCTDCHDPHVAGPGGDAPIQAAHVDACVRCHGDRAGRDHSHHRAADATCLDCHMPRIVQGFSHVIRTHRIGSVSPSQITGGREPDACGLCHLDRTPRQILGDLERLWSLRLPSGAAPPAIDVDRPIGDSWLASPVSIVRLTVADALARRGDRADAPRLRAILDDPIAYNRMRVLIALESLTGERLEPERYDPRAPPGRR